MPRTAKLLAQLRRLIFMQPWEISCKEVFYNAIFITRVQGQNCIRAALLLIWRSAQFQR